MVCKARTRYTPGFRPMPAWPGRQEVLMSGHQVVVIGAGPSGVAAAVSLRDRGLHPLLMDRADEVGASWRGRYDRLKLNTPRDCSHLPDRPYPKGTPIYPTRADVVEHLHRHAHEDGIELWLGTEVHRIDKRSGGWRLQTSRGDVDARQVVVATGYEHTPVIPDWHRKGRLHRRAAAFRSLPQSDALPGQAGLGRRRGFLGV